jgi:hypothetical protein
VSSTLRSYHTFPNETKCPNVEDLRCGSNIRKLFSALIVPKRLCTHHMQPCGRTDENDDEGRGRRGRGNGSGRGEDEVEGEGDGEERARRGRGRGRVTGRGREGWKEGDDDDGYARETCREVGRSVDRGSGTVGLGGGEESPTVRTYR